MHTMSVGTYVVPADGLCNGGCLPSTAACIRTVQGAWRAAK